MCTRNSDRQQTLEDLKKRGFSTERYDNEIDNYKTLDARDQMLKDLRRVERTASLRLERIRTLVDDIVAKNPDWVDRNVPSED